jgi:hypothetical protein
MPTYGYARVFLVNRFGNVLKRFCRLESPRQSSRSRARLRRPPAAPIPRVVRLCRNQAVLRFAREARAIGLLCERAALARRNPHEPADAGAHHISTITEASYTKYLTFPGRQPHHPSWRERFAAPPPAPENPTPVEAMAWRLRTPQGKQLYGLRKQTPEPVFGIIKSVMGFRQFLLRGLDCVRGEWSLVTMAWNIKRMHALSLG